MALSTDFLTLAQTLLRLSPGRPKQAELRRAVSTAYYAAFHFLVEQVTRHRVGRAAKWSRVRATAARHFTHSGMKRLCDDVAKGKWPKETKVAEHFSLSPVPPQALRDLAAAFVALQDARHDADYNATQSFTRQSATALVQRAQAIPGYWAALPDDDATRLFIELLGSGRGRDG